MYVSVFSGFASRCITLVHAYYIVKQVQSDKKLIVIWPITADCAISYNEVFDSTQFDDIVFKVINLKKIGIRGGIGKYT